MKLIDRYVYDVTRRLPESQRKDVARELTAEIESMVEDRAGSEKVAKRQVYAILLELGNPRQLADQYREKPRFIIGPDYYEPYISLLKTICAVVIPLLVFIVWVNEVMTVSHSVGSILLKVAGVILEASVHIFFWTTLSFVFIEKVAAGQRHDQSWTPDDLPELPPEQEITRGESYFAIAWSIFAVLATVFQIPAVYDLVGPDDVPQFFAPEMWPAWTLGLLAVALLGLATEVVKLFVGGWNRLTTILITVVNIITVTFFAGLLFVVDPIANPDMTALISKSLGDAAMVQSIERGIDIFVAIIVLICVWEIGSAVHKYRKGRR